MESFSHLPVMLAEVLEALDIRPDGIYLDGTAGGGGHSFEIAKRLTTGHLIALDRDPEAVAAATKRLAGLPATVIESNFRQAGAILPPLGYTALDGALLDLGVSSHQLDTAHRGFSYNQDGPLDMRMGPDADSAETLVNNASAEELTDILRRYGEEPHAYYIAKKIVERRSAAPITGTAQLADIVASALPAAVRRKEKNPARRTFQALRIAVNDEMGALAEGLEAIFNLLNPGGRFAVITFHSLEDRIVKQTFKEFCTGCICPPQLPVCVCGRKPRAAAVTHKPEKATEEEQTQNRRARSASLRVIQKI